MTTPRTQLDGPALLSWARRAAALLDQHRVEINNLNVFPVPDSDTGSNMAHTMAAAVREADQRGLDTSSARADDVANALSVGSIKGARGNSGVVLSQVLRGLAQEAMTGDIDGETFVRALRTSVTFVERAIAVPVEGTIISVLRAAAVAVSDHDADTHAASLEELARIALDAASDALEKTPSQLAELREAGVVDAGGMGLVLLLRALNEVITGAEASSREASHDENVPHEEQGNAHTHGSAHWLEVMFYITGDVDELETQFAPLGESLVIARATDTEATVHIHSLDAGRVIETAMGLGALSNLRIEVLPPVIAEEPRESVQRLVIAVTPPGSVAELFEQAGAVCVPPGPLLADDVARAARMHQPREVIVLPSNELNADELDEIRATVISAVCGTTDSSATSTDNADSEAPQVEILSDVGLINGIAAIAVHDPDEPLAAAVASMREAAEEMVVAELDSTPTMAPHRDHVVDPDIVVTLEGERIAMGPTVPAAVYEGCRALMEQRNGELITLLVDPEDAYDIDPEIIRADTSADVVVYPADGLRHVGFIGVE
ncbi:DAK2 domain-containing protein [Corynebacterium aquatimens]|uniref:DAK2 domain fusion protein YloV n=1 Tax=Corynebacterium aquatimens TaxID=1190508 RepID=A0A931DYP3_9CORY|nr:DAK2 domain-containing protein [Corynebacterium aquatimens]MBG6121459.1 DAK2 domain fusion protein YloV [Corynebacterium aquatimens]WJY65997.1 DAK2 domain protein [Corynebacterium aquatimens]